MGSFSIYRYFEISRSVRPIEAKNRHIDISKFRNIDIVCGKQTFLIDISTYRNFEISTYRNIETMPKTKERKKEIIEELKKLAEQQKVVVFIVISGIKTPELFSLRDKLRETDAVLKVAKKTLAEIAFSGKGISFPKEEIKEPMGFVFGKKDEILPLKILYQFQKENEHFKIFGGFLDGQFLEKEKIVELAQLPSKDELIGNFISILSSPIRNFIYALDYNLKGLLIVLQNIANK